MQDFFKYKTVNFDKLKGFGFEKTEDGYAYRTPIADGQFYLNVKVDCNGNISSHTVDVATGDEYALHLVEGASGSFVGYVRSEYESVLAKISEKCFETDIFKGQCAHTVIDYVRKKYGDELEFLWEKFSDSAIIRRKDNQKWYAVFIKVSRCKLGLNGEDKVDIIDLRGDEQAVNSLVDGVRYLPAYHMNKKHWFTVCLDGSVPAEEICARLDASYELAKKK